MKAAWAIKKYTVTFDLDEGTGDFPAQTVEHGAKATAPETEPTKEGFFFGGWMNGEVAYTFEEEVTADVTLKAKWSSDPVYTVTLDYGYEGSKNGSVKATKDAEYKITKPAATREGYTFDKWVDAAGKEVTFPLTVSADTTIKATWLSNVTVKFMNGDTVVDTQTVAAGTKVAKPATDPAKTGYKFEGWYTDKDTLATAYNPDAAVTADTTVYAKWSVIEYTITYVIPEEYADFVTNPNTVAKYTIESDDIEIADATVSGDYAYAGWYSDEELTSKIKKIEKGSTGNKSIYLALMDKIIFSGSHEVNWGGDALMLGKDKFKYLTAYSLVKITYTTVGAAANDYPQMKFCDTTNGWAALLNVSFTKDDPDNSVTYVTFSSEMLEIMKTADVPVQGIGAIINKIEYISEMSVLKESESNLGQWSYTMSLDDLESLPTNSELALICRAPNNAEFDKDGNIYYGGYICPIDEVKFTDESNEETYNNLYWSRDETNQVQLKSPSNGFQEGSYKMVQFVKVSDIISAIQNTDAIDGVTCSKVAFNVWNVDLIKILIYTPAM